MASAPVPQCSPDHLVSMFIECTLYGVFLTLFIPATCLLTSRLGMLRVRSLQVEKQERLSLWIYLCLSVMMFLCITNVWVFSWVRQLKPDLIDAGSTTSLFENSGNEPLNPKFFGRAVPFVAASKFSDMILTYRLWVITRKSTKMMAFPILVWIGYFVTFVGVPVAYENDKVISMPWVFVLVCLSVCLNVYFTGSILYQVRKLGTLVRSGGGDVSKAITIIIESAAIYTMWLIVYTIAYLTHADMIADVMSNGITYVAGIVSMLVNVRVGLNWAWDAHDPSPNTFLTEADVEP